MKDGLMYQQRVEQYLSEGWGCNRKDFDAQKLTLRSKRQG